MRAQKQGLKVGAFGKERLVYHNDYVVHEDLGFCRFLAPEFMEDPQPGEIMLEFAVRFFFAFFLHEDIELSAASGSCAVLSSFQYHNVM